MKRYGYLSNGWMYVQEPHPDGKKLIFQKKSGMYYLRIEETYLPKEYLVCIDSFIEATQDEIVEYRRLMIHESEKGSSNIRNIRQDRMMELEILLELHHYCQGNNPLLPDELLEGTTLEKGINGPEDQC